jgi:hypothetical protein
MVNWIALHFPLVLYLQISMTCTQMYPFPP